MGGNEQKRSTETLVPCSCLQLNAVGERKKKKKSLSRETQKMSASWLRKGVTLTPEDLLLLTARLKAEPLLFRNCHRLGSASK